MLDVVVKTRELYLTIENITDVYAPFGGSAMIPCRLSWDDAFGIPWFGPTPPVELQWIIDGFGYHLDSLKESFGGRYSIRQEGKSGQFMKKSFDSSLGTIKKYKI